MVENKIAKDSEKYFPMSHLEASVISVLTERLCRLEISLEDTEKEYIGSVVCSILEEKKRITPTRGLLAEMLDEISEHVLPSLSEHTCDEISSEIRELSVDWLLLVFPDAKSVIGCETGTDGVMNEFPLLEFPDLSLAYMGLELLRHTSLSVFRGKIYGLVGKNGVGKTTLMNKLCNREVPGFPQSCRTAMVKHELAGDWELLTPREIIKDPSTLLSVGFNGSCASLADTPCSDLSGGWRMRTSIGRTISGGADNIDLLLLDEPTNHLDRECVEWLISFLKNLGHVAVVIVSHDEEFLDRTVDYIIYFNNLRLKTVASNLSDFIKSENLDPLTLAPKNSETLFVPNVPALPLLFPKPGGLDGVKTTSQTVAKLEDVTFHYPITKGRSAGVENISGRISLASRIALIGPNGAGKSTIVSLLVGSLIPDSGSVYRHPNLRVAFVSQHHVHHLEEFLDKSCLDYFVDRFGTGLDKEVMLLDSITESGYEKLDREAKAKKFGPQCNNRSCYGGVESLLGRVKQGKEYAYQVKWAGQPEDRTDWIPRSVLETELGVGKLCAGLDSIIAMKKSGTDQRQLDYKSIKDYLKNFGILPHTAEGKIAGLSGGQKSRVTLAAAMWTYPHLLVLDEPTNYLDAASLDSLLDAISNFQGAVVVISHNKPFVEKFSKERWVIEGGKFLRSEFV